MGLLSSVRDIMLVPNPGGKQIGRIRSILERDARSRTILVSHCQDTLKFLRTHSWNSQNQN
ncbi:MAG: hypothetical protein A2168_01660 [Planctomycetes bacterium RBG_13_50_24]|nr:MAG: hypothetical protein A2168_01660 [Planctomycetes bacterium RBG_13_50_24]